MAIDGVSIKKKLEREQRSGKRVTLYLDEEIYKDFQKHTKPLPASKVILELMKEYMATTDGPMRTKYKRSKDK